MFCSRLCFLSRLYIELLSVLAELVQGVFDQLSDHSGFAAPPHTFSEQGKTLTLMPLRKCYFQPDNNFRGQRLRMGTSKRSHRPSVSSRLYM